MITVSIYQWLCVFGIPSIIGLLIGIFIKRPIEKRIAAQEDAQMKQEAQTNAVMLGVQALLRDRLLQGYKYFEKQGFASYEDKTNMENMHKQYEALGENNVMNARHERFINLPDTPPIEKGA